MRYILIFICFNLLAINLQAQNIYTFDRLFIYDINSINDTIQEKKQLILSNSKDNSYFAQLFEESNKTYKLFFRDNNKLNFSSKINRNDFIRAEFINSDCKGISFWSKKQNQRNKIKTLRKLIMSQSVDTVINSKSYNYYKVRDAKKNKSKTKSNTYRYYVIDVSNKFMQPNFVIPFDYLLWKNAKYKNVGIVKEYGIYNNDKGIIYTRKFDTIIRINKKIIVPNDCEQRIDRVIIQNLP